MRVGPLSAPGRFLLWFGPTERGLVLFLLFSTQLLSTDPDIGYLIMDLDQDVSQDVKQLIAELPTSIKTRILF